MHVSGKRPKRESLGRIIEKFKSGSLRTKLLATMIPLVVLILLATGQVNYKVMNSYIEEGLSRTVRLQTMAMANALAGYLDDCRRELLFLAQGDLSPVRLRDYLLSEHRTGGSGFREIVFLSSRGERCYALVADGEIIEHVTEEVLANIKPNPFNSLEQAGELKQGAVFISQMFEVEYPPGMQARGEISEIIRLITPIEGQSGGYLMLAVDVTHLRRLLSIYNSPKSPIWAYPRTDQLRFSYLFDTRGWILFQSEDPDNLPSEWTNYLARSGYQGTLGRPGLQAAFRPDSDYRHYWKMVTDVREGRHDLTRIQDNSLLSQKTVDEFLAYAPIRFLYDPNEPPLVYCGLAYVDRSKLTFAAGLKLIDVMLIITVITVILVAAVIYFLSRVITNPIIHLSHAVNQVSKDQRLEVIDLPLRGHEVGLLQASVNNMIRTITRLLDEIRIKDQTLKDLSLKEKAPIDEELFKFGEMNDELLSEIVGCGPRMEKLKSDILKAAQADVDVLIVGETGTGKQLAAEAIHCNSRRSDKPFISINCGALDENLLLDTLFGHVKGAFTEARMDRKGAFLEADGGTLFLDEIQSASPRVQQSLLRAIAMRKIKPLGQDGEIDVNVRLIAATNVDLTKATERGEFREDLYFRLNVISIHTPALRMNKENVLPLAVRFLKEAETLAGKSGLGFSKGALEKLNNHHWPGNIRELKNCITMAAVMAESSIIHDTDIRLGRDSDLLSFDREAMASSERPEGFSASENPQGFESGDKSEGLPSAEQKQESEPGENIQGAASSQGAPTAKNGDVGKAEKNVREKIEPLSQLNSRQRRAFGYIVHRGAITRSEYQDLIGGGLPSRTAIYDLQDFVKKGFLIKVGRGPATRYVTPENTKAR